MVALNCWWIYTKIGNQRRSSYNDIYYIPIEVFGRARYHYSDDQVCDIAVITYIALLALLCNNCKRLPSAAEEQRLRERARRSSRSPRSRHLVIRDSRHSIVPPSHTIRTDNHNPRPLIKYSIHLTTKHYHISPQTQIKSFEVF